MPSPIPISFPDDQSVFDACFAVTNTLKDVATKPGDSVTVQVQSNNIGKLEAVACIMLCAGGRAGVPNIKSMETTFKNDAVSLTFTADKEGNFPVYGIEEKLREIQSDLFPANRKTPSKISVKGAQKPYYAFGFASPELGEEMSMIMQTLCTAYGFRVEENQAGDKPLALIKKFGTSNSDVLIVREDVYEKLRKNESAQERGRGATG